MLDRVEDHWGFPGADAVGEGEIADVQPLWAGIQTGRSKPIFAHPIDELEYLDFEEQSETKHEYVDGYVYAMAGASDEHGTIAFNLAGAVHPLLRGKRCKGFLSDMKVEIPVSADAKKTGRRKYYYPDFIITCSEADLSPTANKIKKEPCLVVEVLSPGSTEMTDRVEKVDNYLRIFTLQQYWLVDQDRLHILIYTRDGTDWRMTEHTSPEIMLPLPAGDGNLKVRLGDLYEKVFDI